MCAPKDGYLGSGTGSYAVCLYASEIHRRTQAGEPQWKIASALRLPRHMIVRMCMICRALGHAPSQERLAVCVMRTPDLSDDEIAELFGRSLAWVKSVRARMDEIRQREPIDESLEYLDDGVVPGDPSPAEIAARAENLRAMWVGGLQGNYPVIPGVQGGAKQAGRLDKVAPEAIA